MAPQNLKNPGSDAHFKEDEVGGEPLVEPYTGMTCQSDPHGSVSTRTGQIWNYWRSSLRRTEIRTEYLEMKARASHFGSQYMLTDLGGDHRNQTACCG